VEREHFLALLQSTTLSDCKDLRSAVYLNGRILFYNVDKAELSINLTPTSMLDVNDAVSMVVWVSEYGIQQPYVYSIALPVSMDAWTDNIDWKAMTALLQILMWKVFNKLFRGDITVTKIIFSRNHPKLDYTSDAITIATTEGESLLTFYRTQKANTMGINYQGTTFYVDVSDMDNSQCLTYLPLVAAYWEGKIKAKYAPVVASIGKKQNQIGE